MKLKYKKLNDSVPTPTYATDGAACFDLVAVSAEYDTDGNFYSYDTGIAVEIPSNHVGLLFPRSSNTKKDLILGNSVGVIDSDYRGYISFRYKPLKHFAFRNAYEVGERVGQLMIVPIPRIELEEVSELSETIRGDGGYGSTGS